MKIGQNTYKLILLDTNALREIVTNTNLSGKGFLQTFFTGESSYAPCFSIYNVIELMPYEDIYEKFLEYFSIIPCLMTFPAKSIFQMEVDCYMKGIPFEITNQVAYAFTPLSNEIGYNCKHFFDNLVNQTSLMDAIHSEINDFPSTAREWELKRSNAKRMLKQQHLPLNMIDDKYYKFHEAETVIKDLINFDIPVTSNINISKLPASRMMEYSQFLRIFKTQKTIKPNDVMDVLISSIAPYVDAVITENFQADVYKKAKKLIPQIKELEIYRLRDIRMEN